MKFKIKLKTDADSKKLWLFPDVETLYVWTQSLERGAPHKAEGVEELTLERGAFIEVELQGFEYVYETPQKFYRFNLVRLAKVQQTQNSSGKVASVHTGWTSNGLMPLKQSASSDMIVQILSKDETQLDFITLFADEIEEKDVEEDEED